MMETGAAVRSPAALALETRRAFRPRLLGQAGPEGLAEGRISENPGQAPSSLSYYPKNLVRADLVSLRQDGGFLIHAAAFQAMNALLA
jgi:hypothetical protein